MNTFKERLNQILPRLTSEKLLSNQGLGNEIGFYIFDYPPECELYIREHIQFIIQRLPKQKPDIHFKHISLFPLIIDYLRKRNLLDRAIQIQLKKGNFEFLKVISRVSKNLSK